MHYYFNKELNQWPTSLLFPNSPQSIEQQETLVNQLQDIKTSFFLKNILQAKARPGVLELMDEIIANNKYKVGICSASSREGFNSLVEIVVGSER